MNHSPAVIGERSTEWVVEEGLKGAMKWINGELQDDPEANVNLLIDRASQQFNLTPLQADFLYREYARTGNRPTPE